MTTTDDAPIYCELCRLPHRRGTVECDECGHSLGTQPDWGAVERQLPGLRMKMALGAVALIAMIGANRAVFGGAGYIITLAPLFLIVQSLYRYAILTKRLAARERP
jgi:hypothetical protein